MHAYIIVGHDTSVKEEELIKKLNGKSIEFPIAKIEDVRELSRFSKLTQEENTVVLIRDVDNATTEALNAFLKNLEDPQKNISFILTAKNEHKVLSTILSRCQVIRAQVNKKNKTPEIAEFLNSAIGGKFSHVDRIKTRPEAIGFVQSLIEGLHSDLTIEKGKNELITIAKRISIAQETLNKLDANGNVNLQLSDLVVNLVAGQIS